MAQDVQLILSSKDFESAQFDPVALINEIMPNEQSLSDIDVVIGKVQASMQKLDEDIRRDVRYYSTQRTRATNAFRESQLSIAELFGKIHEIKAKAEQSEDMVQEICRDIKTLDHAKVHLTASIKTLRRLQMLTSAVDQLRSHATARQYREAGNLLEAISQLAPSFVKFNTIPKVEDLNFEISIFKRKLAEQSKEEFKKYDSQLNSNLTAYGVGPNLLRDVCFVITSLGPAAKADFISWFIESQLQDYKISFPESSELSRLGHVDRRYGWLMRELQYIDEAYIKIFPEEWQIHIKIAVEFCISTRLTIAALLESSKYNLDVYALVLALKRTVDFERDLCAKLQEYEKPIKSPKVEVPLIEVEEPVDPLSGKFSAEAIKKKWEKYLEQKEKEKLEQEISPPPSPPVAESLVSQFKGMISTCFDPYMDHYILEEDQIMRELLEKIIAEESWIVPVSPYNKVLLSAADLIYYFNEARKKCASLTKGQPLYDLFLLFKKYLMAYATALHNKIEEHPINSPKALSETEELATIMIINTAEYCGSTTLQMTQTVSKIIDEKFQDKLDLAAEADAFSGVTSRGLKSLANHLEAKMESALQSMAKIKWGEVAQVDEQSNYVSQIGEVLQATLPRFKLSLSGAHYSYVCDAFVTSFVSRGILQNIYKSKVISVDGAHQLLLDIAIIKNALLHVVGQPPPTRFAKLVNKEIGRVEAILKLLTMPNDAIVRGYYTMIPDGTDSDLNKILALKGMKRDERKDLLQRHLNPSPLPPASSSPSPSLLPPIPHSLSVPRPSSRSISPMRASIPSPRSESPIFPSTFGSSGGSASPSIPSFFSSAPTSVVMPAALKASLKNFLPDWGK